MSKNLLAEKMALMRTLSNEELLTEFKRVQDTHTTNITLAEKFYVFLLLASMGNKPPARAGYIYLMSGGGLHKIGKALDPERRRKEHEKKTGREMSIICTIHTANMITLEQALLSLFCDKLKEGAEWFALASEDVAFIRELTICQ